MRAEIYELFSLAMRYVFAALMALIVLRAWRVTAVDRRRSTQLRRLNPETGLIGELLVTQGGGRVRTGQSCPVILEGAIGSARRADIRLRHPSVYAIHADYQMTEEGLRLRARGSAPLYDGVGRRVRELVLRDGDYLVLGDLRLMLVLIGAATVPEELARETPPTRRVGDAVPDMEDDTDVFDIDPDDGGGLFGVDGDQYDDFDDYEDY